ncbi:MAG: hypothetical protein BWY10_01510 [Chloroflexi bacterium ADurb.Bin180]|nr:MAG: hypothetical protein BWY10_01510 [Chloroflexi bacterium ADurb.Bin180]HOU25022.1 hypothetical protein [Anaerolineae bacterium]HQJ51321.1 hypothetical protein [Anaerolineae bacterium]
MARNGAMILSAPLIRMAAGGGAAFWVANLAISRTRIAAEYRAALSISYWPMIGASLAGGLLIGLLVSYGLLRFYDRIPTASPVTKAVILCVLVLIMATVALGLPATRATSGDAWRYFLIGTLINLVRILALGVAVGWLY